METTSEAMERLNRRAWQTGETVRWFANATGFLDPGERAAFRRLAPEATGNPVLDLGIGGGRTTAQLLPYTDDYVGIDYTPQMVETCRQKYAGVRFEVADARDLSLFGPATFQLVLFSYNGIDAVDLDGRRRVLAEAWRVLQPGGAFFFSTFNRDGPDFDPRLRLCRGLHLTWNPLRLASRLARCVVGNGLGQLRRLANQHFEQRENGHGILLHTAHDYGILVYATTAEELAQQLDEAGFGSPAEVISSRSGDTIDGEFGRDEVYVHVIARKPE